MQKKSGGVTFLLNLLIPGAGHVYASDGQKWGLLAINLACAITGAVLILPWLGNLIVWIVAMADSSRITEEYNLQVELEAEEEQGERARREAAARAAEVAGKRVAREQEEEEAARRARAAEIDAQRTRGAELARRFMQVHSLRQAGVLDEDEAARERAKLLATHVRGWTDEDMPEFLAPFAELVAAEAVSAQEMKAVKSLYQGLQKGRPA